MHSDGTHAFASTKRFVIERELGHGGMGVVYQALDLERNTQVALKALTQRDAVNIYRLKNEFRQLADLSHPNLVMLHELCNEGNSWFFTMELVQGKSFDVYVAEDRLSLVPHDRASVETNQGGRYLDASITLSQRAIGSEFPLPRVTCNLKRLRHALRQLVEAVAALHDAGKLHRDLKPSNVLVTAEGRVVVLDFGLVSNSTVLEADAQDADRTVGGCMFGTPAYMAPEQAAGDTVTTAADWYSVGTMLYEALTGQLPFDGSVLDILRQKETSEPVAPSELVRGVPDDLDQLCRDLLRRDPSQRPSGPDILRYLTGHSAPPPVFDAESSNIVRKYGELFIGRESHLSELRAAFEQSRTGKPTAVFVHGFSGMGKSALVRCFANELIRNDEAVVLRGRCYERETVPYKAFDNIIDALSRYMMRLPSEEAAELLPRNVHSLALLFPVLRRVKAVAQARRPKNVTADARELRNQAFAALKDLLLRITDFHPLVINIDDLQWADMDSARLLSFLMGPPDPPPLLLVGTYRRDEAENSAFLRHIVSERGLGHGAAEVRELPLDALSEEEAQQLSTALLRDLEGVNALASNAIAAEAEGVPFFIAELVQHVKSHREGTELPLSAEPVTLDQVILERVGGMPEPAQRLLRVLSVAAGPLEQGVAIEAAGLARGDRTATLALRAARLIRTRGTRQNDSAETYHDRVRETVVRHLAAHELREIHAAIAAALERHEVADPERLVVHYTGAGDGGRAGETAVQAAHTAAQKLAFNRAAELFTKAIELLPTNDAQARELYKHMGDALANAGRGAQAAEAYLKAAEGASELDQTKLKTAAAQQYLRSGRIAQGLPLMIDLLREVHVEYPTTPSGAIVRIVAERARIAAKGTSSNIHAKRASSMALRRLATLNSVFREVFAFDPLGAAYLQARFYREAMSTANSASLMPAIAWEALNTASANGESRRARTQLLLDRAGVLAEQLNQPYGTATYSFARAACSMCMGEFHDVERLAMEAESIFRSQCRGSDWEATFCRTWRYAAIELGGNLATLVREAPGNERDAREKGDEYALAYLAIVTPMTQMMRDDPGSAIDDLREQAKRLGPQFNTFHLWVMDRMTDVLLYQADEAGAWAYLSSQWPQFQKSFNSRIRLLRVNGHFLYARTALSAAMKTSDRKLVVATNKALTELQKYARPDAAAYAHLIAAGLARLQGNETCARENLSAAAAVCEKSGMHNFQLYATRNLAVLDANSALLEQVDARLKAMGVSKPDRWTAAYAPGFG